MSRPLVDVQPPIRVAVMASKSDDRLRHLLEEDANRGETYELVGAFVNVSESAAIPLLEAYDVPVSVRDIHDFYDHRDADLSDMTVREAFDVQAARAIAAYDPDLVVLSGYLHVLTTPVLDRFQPGIVNAHHGDLTVRDGSGEPLYTGLDAVKDAIRNGETDTRETTHLVTEAVDAGPLIARSRPFPVHRPLVADSLATDEDVLDAYVYAHRGWMVREGGGPTLAKTIELIADGRVTVDAGETYIDGEAGYYQLGDGVV